MLSSVWNISSISYFNLIDVFYIYSVFSTYVYLVNIYISLIFFGFDASVCSLTKNIPELFIPELHQFLLEDSGSLAVIHTTRKRKHHFEVSLASTPASPLSLCLFAMVTVMEHPYEGYKISISLCILIVFGTYPLCLKL